MRKYNKNTNELEAAVCNCCGKSMKIKEQLFPYRKLLTLASSNKTFLIKESTNLESTVVPRAAVLFLV